jgi:hypothetical protein
MKDFVFFTTKDDKNVLLPTNSIALQIEKNPEKATVSFLDKEYEITVAQALNILSQVKDSCAFVYNDSTIDKDKILELLRNILIHYFPKPEDSVSLSDKDFNRTIKRVREELICTLQILGVDPQRCDTNSANQFLNDFIAFRKKCWEKQIGQ